MLDAVSTQGMGMDFTDNLELPYIMPSQAQKHVTHNEAIGILDALVQLAVVTRGLALPPASPANGSCFIVGSDASEAWSGQDNSIAHRLDGAWSFYPPRPGYLCHVADEDQFVYWDGSDWARLCAIEELQNLGLLGVGTTADAANPFAAKLNKALWTARQVGEGGDGDLRLTLNKESTADTLSLLMQTGYSGRAELGLTGSDDLAVKVSADGVAWTTALAIDQTTGRVTVCGDPTGPLGIATRQYAVGRAGDTMTGDLIVSQAGPSELKTISDGSTSTATLESYRTSTAAHCSVVGNAAYGSLAAPAFVGAAEANLFELSARPWSGSTFGQQARIAFVSSEAHSATALGVDCVVSCTAGGGTLRQDVVRISAATGLAMFGSNIVIDANRHLRLRSYTIATLPSVAAAGQVIFCSDLGGGGGQLVSDATRWRRASQGGTMTVNTNADFALTVLTSAEEQRHTGTLTANRTIALSATNAYVGARFRVTRTGSGPFNLSLGGLKNLVTNSWAEAVYDSGGWYLAAYGTL